MAYENRQFMILNTSEISSIRFDDVLESSASTLRRSVDGSKIIDILSTSDWISEVPDEI